MSDNIHIHPRLGEVIERNSTALVQTSRVVVNGTDTFRSGFLEQQLNPLFTPTTLKKHLQSLDTVTQSILNLQSHQNVSAYIDIGSPAPNLNSISQIDSALNLTTVLTFTNPTPHSFCFSTNTTSNDPLFNINASLNNLFGGGESLKLSTYTSYPSLDLNKGISLAVETPFVNSPLWNLGLEGFWTCDTLAHSSHSRNIQGTAAYIFRQFANTRAEIGIKAANRSIHSLMDSASDSVRVDAGETLQALLYTKSVYNSLNTTIYHPSKGVYAQFVGKVAGISELGDVKYHSLSASTSNYYSVDPLNNRLVFNFQGAAGVLIDDAKTTITDRLLLLPVYGYENNGIGPKDCQDAVGGNAAISASAAAYAKFPQLPSNSPLRLKAGFNGGSLVSKPDSQDLISNFSTGCGIGLSYQCPQASMELMYVMPLHSGSNDVTKKGLQFQVGLNI